MDGERGKCTAGGGTMIGWVGLLVRSGVRTLSPTRLPRGAPVGAPYGGLRTVALRDTFLGYSAHMDSTDRRSPFHRADWALVAIASICAGGFAISSLRVLDLFLHSYAGIPPRFVLLVLLPLFVAVAAAVALASRQVTATRIGDRSTSWGP